MSRRTVGIVIDRLLSDRDLRVRLALDPFETLADLSDLGVELTREEIDVFLQTDVRVWFWGSDDDTLFRLVTLGTAGLQKEGYQRLGEGTVKGPMPAMGKLIQTSDDLWKIIAWIRSINPPPSPPPPNE